MLRALPYGESDLILHTLSHQGERLNLLARGARKSKKRFGGGVLQPPHYIQTVISQKKSHSELFLLQEAQLLNDFPLLKSDYDRIETALYFVKMIDKVSHFQTAGAQQLFDLLGNGLKLTELTVDLSLLRLHFNVKFLFMLGFLQVNSDWQQLLAVSLKDHLRIQISDQEKSSRLAQINHLIQQAL